MVRTQGNRVGWNGTTGPKLVLGNGGGFDFYRLESSKIVIQRSSFVRNSAKDVSTLGMCVHFTSDFVALLLDWHSADRAMCV